MGNFDTESVITNTGKKSIEQEKSSNPYSRTASAIHFELMRL